MHRLRQLATALRDYAHHTHGRPPTAAKLRIQFGPDDAIVLHLPAMLINPPEADNPKLSETERNLLTAIDALDDGAVITGEAAATKAGYVHGGRIKQALSRLVKLGLIRSSRDGYSRLPDPVE